MNVRSGIPFPSPFAIHKKTVQIQRHSPAGKHPETEKITLCSTRSEQKELPSARPANYAHGRNFF